MAFRGRYRCRIGIFSEHYFIGSNNGAVLLQKLAKLWPCWRVILSKNFALETPRIFHRKVTQSVYVEHRVRLVPIHSLESVQSFKTNVVSKAQFW